jgi:hypothetical protein
MMMTKRIGTIGGFALHEEEDFGGMYLYGIAYLHFDTMAWAFLLPDQFTDTRWMGTSHPKPIRLIEIININYETIFFFACDRDIELFVYLPIQHASERGEYRVEPIRVHGMTAVARDTG